MDWSKFPSDVAQIAGVVPLALARALLILLLSLVFGTLFALLNEARIPVIRQILAVYASCFRGVPILVQLLFWYYFLLNAVGGALGALGISWDAKSLSADAVVIFAFVLCYSAYLMQTVGAALASVDPQQRLLARTLGYSRLQQYVHVIFPEALVYALPNIFNMFLNILKALSMGFVIAVIDIFAKAKIIAGTYGDYMVVYTADALVYWLLCGVLYFIINHAFTSMNEKNGSAAVDA